MGLEPLILALTVVAESVVAEAFGRCSPNRTVAGPVPSQGTCLGGGFGPLSGQLIEVCLALMFLSLPLSLKINKIFLKKTT